MKHLTPIAEQWTQVERLLDEVLALPAEARAAWLEGLEGEAETLRETLRALLRTQAGIETDDFLRTLPPLQPAAPPGTEPHEGEQIGPYRLLRELGRGGMGLVWLAERHDGMAARQVALKLPRLAWGQALAERLAREREILAGLEHPHIARLYDAGVDAHGRPFIAMQYVEGEPIDRYGERLALPVAARIELLLQAMSAVSHAHARLVVHRDIKPANVLVDDAGQVTLLDFGVAKLLDGERTAATALTEIAGRAFTPDYASPEQIRGEPLGTASDVYSLGVLAFELLAGTRPYRLQRGTAAELEEAITQVEPPRASDVAATPELKKALRGDLDAILGKALKKAVADRYPGVDAFAADLQRHLRGEPVLARPDGAGYRLAKFVGRHRLAVFLGTTLTASVLTGAGLALWQAQRARHEEQHAQAENRRQLEVRNLYIETLSRLSVLAADQPQALERPGAVTAVLLEKLREMAPREATKPEARAAQLEAVMLQLNYDGQMEASLSVAQEYVDLLIAQKAPPIQVLTAYATMGRTLHLLRRFEEAEAVRRKALAYAPENHDRDVEFLRLTVLTDLSGLLIGRGRRSEALDVFRQAHALAASGRAGVGVGHRVHIFEGLFHLGFDDAQALRSQRRAGDEIKGRATLDPDDLAFNAWHLGEALAANGQLDEAETVLTDSLSRYVQEYGRRSRNASLAFGRLAGVIARRDPARALAREGSEQQALASTGGLDAIADITLRAARFETAWLSGQSLVPAGLPDAGAAASPGALRDQERLHLYAARSLVLAGRADDGLRIAAFLAARWPDPGLQTLPWVRIQQVLAEAQLGAGHWAEAQRTATALVALLERAGGTHAAAFRAALSISALAAARQADVATAQRALARLATDPMPPFASPVEQADVELRRAQALLALGRPGEAAAIARPCVAALKDQSPQSPRLALARSLAGG